jgi:hypothetical protein
MKQKLLRACISVLIQVLAVNAVIAQSKAGARFQGQIKSELDSSKLYAYVTPAYLKEANASSSRVYINIDKEGKFSFALPAVEYPARIYMYENESGATVFNYALVEAKDNIHVDIDLGENEPAINFTGNGSAKYNCAKKISKLLEKTVTFAGHVNEKTADSILYQSNRILKSYQRKIPPAIVDIMRTDIIAELNLNALASAIPYQVFHGDATPSDSSYFEAKSAFSELDKQRNLTNENIIFQSPAYINYLYEKIKLKTIFSRNGKVTFEKFYNEIKRSSKGLIRERLFVSLLQHSTDLYLLFAGTDPDVFKKCVLEADAMITHPSMKRMIDDIKQSRIKGADLFDMRLPADSSGTMVNLSDFKGKVALLDCWAYNCTGCSKFAQLFHKKVYPLFASNPDFKVVSVMVDEGTEKAFRGYMHRLRQEIDPGFEDISIYTYRDYTNLFAGRKDKRVRDFESHYNIVGYPFILLIGRNGKIFSSTTPFFTSEKDSEQVDKMIKLISDALSQP